MSPFKDTYAQAWCECLRQRNARGTADDLPWPRVYSRAATGSRTSERVRGTRSFSELVGLRAYQPSNRIFPNWNSAAYTFATRIRIRHRRSEFIHPIWKVCREGNLHLRDVDVSVVALQYDSLREPGISQIKPHLGMRK